MVCVPIAAFVPLTITRSTPMKTIVIKHYIPLGALTAALIAFCPLQTRANTLAISFTGGTAVGIGANVTAGCAFTLSSPVLVTELGLWDFGNDGFDTSHVVTIWTSTGTQEAQGTIPSGAGAILTNGFRYVSIAPVLLPAGSYTIGGFYSSTDSDQIVTSASTITTASGVIYDGSRIGLGFAFPPIDISGVPNSNFGQISNLPRGHQSPTEERPFPFLGFLSWAWPSFVGRFWPNGCLRNHNLPALDFRRAEKHFAQG